MNLAHRIIACLAAALALAVVAAGINALLEPSADGGWVSYPPVGDPIVSSSSSDGNVLRGCLVWLCAIGAWLLLACGCSGTDSAELTGGRQVVRRRSLLEGRLP